MARKSGEFQLEDLIAIAAQVEDKILGSLKFLPGDGFKQFGDRRGQNAEAGGFFLWEIDGFCELRDSELDREILGFGSDVGLGYSESINAYQFPSCVAYVFHPDDDGEVLLALAPEFNTEHAIALAHVIFDELSYDPEDHHERDEWFAFADCHEGYTSLVTDDHLVLWIAAGAPPKPIDQEGKPFLFDTADEWTAYIEKNRTDR